MTANSCTLPFNRPRQWMIATGDHCLAAFDVRADPDKLTAAVAAYPKLDKSAHASNGAEEERRCLLCARESR